MTPTNILLVDDKKENLLALESLLRNPTIQFHRATSGVQALELLLAHEFALALVDVQMPEMDGFELAELMRGAEQTKHIPIIFVTAGVHDRLKVFRGYEMGAVDFLYKPLDPHIVKSKVNVFLELARQKQLLKIQLNERDGALALARDALRARDEFMSVASHELKTPITSLFLQIQLITRAVQKGGDQAKLVTSITNSITMCERQTRKLTALVDSLLDLTRVRSGKLELNRERLNFSSIVSDVVEKLAAEAQAGKTPITIKAPKEVWGDFDLMRTEQVVTNLVSNAIKYGNHKPIEIRVEKIESAVSGAGSWVRLTVLDNGMGIAPHLQAKIFERFERAVNSGEISGLGLGLYIARQIVEAHGGFIKIQSAAGTGSTFLVELPISN